MKQRTSTRQVKLSKAFRVVDDETRRQVAEQRLLSLEHDNYNEQEVAGLGADDEDYASDVSYCVAWSAVSCVIVCARSFRIQMHQRGNEAKRIAKETSLNRS